MKTVKELLEMIEQETTRSAWAKGVKVYAKELAEALAENHGLDHEVNGSPADKKELLNGAENWKQYSEGGSALIYDGDIAERLCNPTELKRTHNGERDPNPNENWIDVQARALTQAAALIMRLARK